jgi:hypothetical protein
MVLTARGSNKDFDHSRIYLLVVLYYCGNEGLGFVGLQFRLKFDACTPRLSICQSSLLPLEFPFSYKSLPLQ